MENWTKPDINDLHMIFQLCITSYEDARAERTPPCDFLGATGVKIVRDQNFSKIVDGKLDQPDFTFKCPPPGAKKLSKAPKQQKQKNE